MIGKSDLPNLPGRFLLPDPLFHPQFFQFLPGWNVRQHMHEVIINVIGLQAAQFLLKHFFHAIDRLDQIMRKLCGKVDFLPAMIPV